MIAGTSFDSGSITRTFRKETSMSTINIIDRCARVANAPRDYGEVARRA
jgi:hypothetical protein